MERTEKQIQTQTSTLLFSVNYEWILKKIRPPWAIHCTWTSWEDPSWARANRMLTLVFKCWPEPIPPTYRWRQPRASEWPVLETTSRADFSLEKRTGWEMCITWLKTRTERWTMKDWNTYLPEKIPEQQQQDQTLTDSNGGALMKSPLILTD